jgi:protein involved in polysaccharide export with SLBB domain
MVINLEELDLLSESAQNIELMAGDTLTIPSDPQTVSVLGEVYTPISMIYEPGQTVEYYLDQVGGLKDTANKGEVYVVRADGSVVSKQQKRRGRFYSLTLYPGDVVMVPEKVKTSDWMSFTKDLTTILYQISIGAAVVLAL